MPKTLFKRDKKSGYLVRKEGDIIVTICDNAVTEDGFTPCVWWTVEIVPKALKNIALSESATAILQRNGTIYIEDLDNRRDINKQHIHKALIDKACAEALYACRGLKELLTALS